MKRRTVVGIPPSYNSDESLELQSTKNYLNYLSKHKVDTAMTTAGTSHFNLLSEKEILDFNFIVMENFSRSKIIGIPAFSTIRAIEFVKQLENNDQQVNFMVLYPERFYSEEQIYDYCSRIREVTNNPLYIHGKPIRIASGGTWDYSSEILNKMFDNNVICGIKEEHSNLQKSYNFVSGLKKEIDVIVAGGSMRRFEFLKSAGANSFLSGVGNFYPEVEQEYLDGKTDNPLRLETELFKVFMPIGWHNALRIGLDYLELTCYNNRDPWPLATEQEKQKIKNVLEWIANEK